MVQFLYGFDASPARSLHPCPTRLPDPPTAKLGSARRPKNDFFEFLFYIPLKMAQFPYGFDINPARSPHPCPTRLPDPPTAKLGSARRPKHDFFDRCFLNPLEKGPISRRF